MLTRPATGHLSSSDIDVILCRSAVLPEEHLVHAWDALRAALRASELDDRAKVAANIYYAMAKLHALDGAAERVKRGKRAAMAEEIAHLKAAIEDAERFF